MQIAELTDRVGNYWTELHRALQLNYREVLWPCHSFRPRWGSYTCPQCRHQWPAEGVETTSWSPSSNLATHHRERPETSEPAGLWSARHRAYDRDLWRDIVETATLQQGHATWWWWSWTICFHYLRSHWSILFFLHFFFCFSTFQGTLQL